MDLQSWRDMPVSRRVRFIRWALPLAIAAVVVVYQLVFAAYVHDRFGHSAHTVVELIFYGVLGPVVSWATLTQIARWLSAKEAAEQTARAHERHLASITNASADAILSLDPNQVIRSWNRGAAAQFGYAAEEAIGQHLDTLLDMRPTPASGPNRPAEGGALSMTPRHYEAVCRTRRGRDVFVDVTQTPLSDDGGRPAGASVILRDITQRKAREAALEEERARIARDLHDGLAQSLYFVGLKLDFLRKQVTREPEQAVQELRALKQTVQANIGEVRRTIFALRPVDLEGLGFEKALRKYVQEFGEQANLETSLELDRGVGCIPPVLEPQIFRLVQEGLNNIAKHAHAHHAWVRLTVDSGATICLDITDDGVGFDPMSMAEKGSSKMGLRQMRERVVSLEGKLQVESVPGHGTRLQVEIPVPMMDAYRMDAYGERV